MKTITQYFQLHKRYLGSRQIPALVVIPGFTVRRQFSYAFFCMRCGDIWGRLLAEDAYLAQIINRPCDKHGDGRLSRTFPTSDMPDAIGPDWPKAALLHELLCELALVGKDYTPSPGFEEILALWCEKETA